MAQARSERHRRQRCLVRGGLITAAILFVLLYVPLVPHTLHCWWDSPIPPPYREAYLAYATEDLDVPHLRFAGRIWLPLWHWLNDTDGMDSNIFYKAAANIADYAVTVDGVTYPPPAEGVALAAELRARGEDPTDYCAIAEIGATGRLRPPGARE